MSEQRQAQLLRQKAAFQAALGPLREVIATMDVAVERWQAEFTENNRRFAWAAAGHVVGAMPR